MAGKNKRPLYSAYVLTSEARNKLLSIFPVAYPARVVAHHVTVQFGNVSADDIPTGKEIKVVGTLDTGDGLQALVVSVDGEVDRPDGSVYHITWSLDNGYKPVDSNKMIKKLGYTPIDHKVLVDFEPKVVFVQEQ